MARPSGCLKKEKHHIFCPMSQQSFFFLMFKKWFIYNKGIHCVTKETCSKRAVFFIAIGKKGFFLSTGQAIQSLLNIPEKSPF